MKDLSVLNRHLEAMNRFLPSAAPTETGNEVTIAQDRLTIALSREAGVPIEEVAREISARLGWPVYDHELLERIAEGMHCSVTVLEQLDERHHSWLLECLEGFASPGLSQSQYTACLIQLIQSLGIGGRCIIVGRGAAFVLPWHSTLRIHLVGDVEDRIASFGHRLHLNRLQSERYVRSIDWERARFVRDYFGRDPGKPGNYDLILNTSEWSATECANLILQSLRSKALASMPGRGALISQETRAPGDTNAH